jgi:hypothetical protein
MRKNRWLTFLERVVLTVFVLTLVVVLVRALGWRPDWWFVVWQICALTFMLTLLMYLNAGGSDRVVHSKVGLAGLVLLALATLANAAGALFEIDLPAWAVAKNVATAGFLVCFVAYVVIRYRQYAGRQ